MSRFLNERYRAMKAYTPGEQPRDMQYIKLNTNESPYPPAPSVAAAMNGEQVALLRLYSDPTAKGLKEKLAGLYGVKPENVFVSNGSDEVLNFAFMAFGGRGVAFPDISYGFYSVFAELHGIPAEIIPLEEDFTLNYRKYCGKNKLVVIANPNAPTGMTIPLHQIEQILRTNSDCLVVIDEAYGLRRKKRPAPDRKVRKSVGGAHLLQIPVSGRRSAGLRLRQPGGHRRSGEDQVFHQSLQY